MAIPHKIDNEIETDFSHKPLQMAATNVSKLISNNARNLYSDPVAAVIREIVANAADASDDVTVTLPTSENLQFIVSDKGAGMSRMQVEGTPDEPGLYLTIGASTKTNDNNSTGEKGIGRFAFLAYGDNATLITKGRVYSFHIDDKDDLVLIPVGKSDEYPTGTTVIVPVKPGDIWKFKDTAKRIMAEFPPSMWPEGLGERPEPFETIDNVTLWGHGNLSVNQGNIKYPVTNSFLGEYFPGDEYKLLREIMNNAITITVPNGTLSTVSSREALNYDPITVENLIAEITKAFTSIKAHYGNMGDTWDVAYEQFAAIRTHGGSSTFVSPFLKSKFSNLNPLNISDLDAVDYTVCPSDIQLQWRSDGKMGNLPLGNYHRGGDHRSMYVKDYSAPDVYVQFEADKVHNARARINHDQGGDHETLVWIKARHPNCPQFQALMERMYFPEYIRVSTLEEPPKAERTTRIGKAPFKLLRQGRERGWNQGHEVLYSDQFPPSTNPDRVNLYIVTDRGFHSVNPHEGTRLATTFNMGEVYLVPQSRFKEISDKENWVEFTAYFTELYAKLSNPQEEAYYYAAQRFFGSEIVDNLRRIGRNELVSIRAPKLKEAPTEVRMIEQFLQVAPDEIDTTEIEALEAKVAELEFWFPMLAVSQYNVQPDALDEYVEFVLAQKEKVSA